MNKITSGAEKSTTKMDPIQSYLGYSSRGVAVPAEDVCPCPKQHSRTTAPGSKTARNRPGRVEILGLLVEYLLLAVFAACCAFPFLLLPLFVSTSYKGRLHSCADLKTLKEFGKTTEAMVNKSESETYYNRVSRKRQRRTDIEYQFEAEGGIHFGTHTSDAPIDPRFWPVRRRESTAKVQLVTVTYLPGNPEIHQVGMPSETRVFEPDRSSHIFLMCVSCLPALAVFGVAFFHCLPSVGNSGRASNKPCVPFAETLRQRESKQ